jgi:hypothetical protein
MNAELRHTLEITRRAGFMPLRDLDPGLTRLPIVPHGRGFVLQDRKGNRISFHRTMTGALRARREKLEETAP